MQIAEPAPPQGPAEGSQPCDAVGVQAEVSVPHGNSSHIFIGPVVHRDWERLYVMYVDSMQDSLILPKDSGPYPQILSAKAFSVSLARDGLWFVPKKSLSGKISNRRCSIGREVLGKRSGLKTDI